MLAPRHAVSYPDWQSSILQAGEEDRSMQEVRDINATLYHGKWEIDLSARFIEDRDTSAALCRSMWQTMNKPKRTRFGNYYGIKCLDGTRLALIVDPTELYESFKRAGLPDAVEVDYYTKLFNHHRSPWWVETMFTISERDSDVIECSKVLDRVQYSQYMYKNIDDFVDEYRDTVVQPEIFQCIQSIKSSRKR